MKPVLFLIVSLLIVGCGKSESEYTFDGSSDQKFGESIDVVTATLTEKQKQELFDAMLVIGQHYGSDDEIREALNGKTFNELLELAQKIKKSN